MIVFDKCYILLMIVIDVDWLNNVYRYVWLMFDWVCWIMFYFFVCMMNEKFVMMFDVCVMFDDCV